MSAQESTIATLQHQLHDENKRRFEQIERNQDRQQMILDKILANTGDLPALKATIEEIEQERWRLTKHGVWAMLHNHFRVVAHECLVRVVLDGALNLALVNGVCAVKS